MEYKFRRHEKSAEYKIAHLKRELKTINDIIDTWSVEKANLMKEINELGKEFRIKGKNVYKMDYILNVVCKELEVNVADVIGKSRVNHIKEARFIYCYLVRDLTRNSLKQMGSSLNNRTHATILHAIESTKNWMETDKQFNSKVINIYNKITEQ